MTRRPAPWIVWLAATVLVAVACGQYPGTYPEGYGQGGAVAGYVDPTTGEFVPAEGGAVAGGGLQGGGLSGGTGGTTGGVLVGGGGTGGAGTGDGGAVGGGGGDTGGTVPTGGDATGVTADTITIGIHAPLTGAAPLKSESFSQGKDLYWNNAGEGGGVVKIFGRSVKVVFKDDRYNPSYARLVCQQMIEQDKVFLLIGGGGTDQIQACAQLAASRGVPYLSSGVTQVGLTSLQNYFAISMSYAQQAPMLASYIKKNFTSDAGRVAMVATNTANFDDAVQAFTQAFPGVTVFRPDKNERGSSMATNLCIGTQKRFDVVFPLTAPVYYLEMAHAASCHPQYAGVGITMGLDAVATGGCPDTAGAVFFSPGPAFADSDKFDKRFRAAGGSDDIQFLLWGLSNQLHQLFANAGANLTREQFIGATEQAVVDGPGIPRLEYSPSNHFGAKQLNILQNLCNPARYVTLAADVSSI
ncbi:MAG: ABC transporter substrate-binding protein [Actinobacteria bacterium]|nr:ABC transporter substrate-binding protein [Actinomycetota bacterium]